MALLKCAISSVVERSLHMRELAGSIPASRTAFVCIQKRKAPRRRGGFYFLLLSTQYHDDQSDRQENGVKRINWP